MNIKYFDIKIMYWLVNKPYFTYNDLYTFILTLGYDHTLAIEITAHILESILIKRYGKYYSLLLWVKTLNI